MLAKIKLMLELSATTFDSELLQYIEQGIVDLQDVGIQVEVTRNATTGQVTSAKTAIEQAILTFCQMNFSLAHGYPSNYDKIAESYNLQKDKLKKMSKYREQ